MPLPLSFWRYWPQACPTSSPSSKGMGTGNNKNSRLGLPLPHPLRVYSSGHAGSGHRNTAILCGKWAPSALIWPALATWKAGRQSGGPKNGAGGHRKPASSGSDDDGDGEPPAHLPLVWTTHDLAATLAVSAKTLQNQPPHYLPPAIRIPGCRGPRYRLRDVLAWLDSFSTGQRPARPLPRKVRGRPRIALSLGKGGVQ